MIRFGREVTGDLSAAQRREWLVTNGIGGYAMGTLAGARTRRYHGLLVAAGSPPAGRMMLLAGLDVWAMVEHARYPLVTHNWAAGVVLPDGYRHLERFFLDGAIPTLVYTLGEVQVIQRVWMHHHHNTTYITYTYRRGSDPIKLELTPLCTYRPHHSVTTGIEAHYPTLHVLDGGVEVIWEPEGLPLRLYANTGEIVMGREWWWDFKLSQETRRGLVDQEDLFAAASITATLPRGTTFCLIATSESPPLLPWQDALEAEKRRQTVLLEASKAGEDAPGWVRRLVLAADQFLVRRKFDAEDGASVIAGYPWFSDWGRDTMIALPGLTLVTGRADVAAAVLRTFARFVDQGMLPNRFPDSGEAPEYNTVDATLWYFVAVHLYLNAENDREVAEELYPVLADIVDWHVQGTRFQIQMDPEDHLLYAGEPGVQLTWMDAKIGDWVVTPRTGKPVEINALWYNALRIIASIAGRLGKEKDMARYETMARRVQDSFNARFWYQAGEYLYDVIDTPDGDDAALRPNQVLVVALPYALLDYQKAKAVVDVCAQKLLTSLGLRSLDPTASQYTGQYMGDLRQRDSVYHQGTVWSWLLGPFALAHYKVYDDAAVALSFLEPLADHLNDAGLGTISEIFDGDPPHTPRGAVAQAWSVGEVLRAWHKLAQALKHTDNEEV